MSNTCVIENANIPLHPSWRNFSGEAGRYNAAGERSFTIFLDPETAERMTADGWGVQELPPRSDEEESQAFLRVKIRYHTRDGRLVKLPPKVVQVVGDRYLYLTEDELGVLDHIVFANADVKLAQYPWETATGSGVAAYLRTIYFTAEEDELDRKYRLMSEESSVDVG